MEGDAGASQLTPNDTDESESEPDAVAVDPAEDLPEPDASTDDDSTEIEGEPRGSSRLGRGGFIGVTVTLAVLAAGLGFGGYLALRSHHDSTATARRDAVAVDAAKDCVAATQAPDIAAMAASAQKIIECGAGAFRSQAILYSSLLVEAYQAANAHVEVSELRAAVERNNPDGSVEILVPLRVKVSNSEAANQEAGYRLRVSMVLDEGRYRISKLDQVAR